MEQPFPSGSFMKIKIFEKRFAEEECGKNVLENQETYTTSQIQLYSATTLPFSGKRSVVVCSALV
jgi:hypothetical protein